MSFRNLLRRGSYLDLDYIYGDALTNAGGEYPLDYQAMAAGRRRPKSWPRTWPPASRCTSTFTTWPRTITGPSRPAAACGGQPPLPVAGKAYYDGGLSDPIPFQQAFQAGCDGWWSSSTGPRTTTGTPKRTSGWPNFCGSIPTPPGFWPCGRDLQPPTGAGPCPGQAGKVLLVAPDDIGGMSTLTKDGGPFSPCTTRGAAMPRPSGPS